MRLSFINNFSNYTDSATHSGWHSYWMWKSRNTIFLSNNWKPDFFFYEPSRVWSRGWFASDMTSGIGRWKYRKLGQLLTQVTAQSCKFAQPGRHFPECQQNKKTLKRLTLGQNFEMSRLCNVKCQASVNEVSSLRSPETSKSETRNVRSDASRGQFNLNYKVRVV